MPVCIYCRKDSSASRSVPHVMPEALAGNRLVLPRGVECDDCNRYAGHKLEPHLVHHPAVAFSIQFLGAPGKSGRPRDELGGITRTRVDETHVRISLKAKGRISVTPDGKRHMVGLIRTPRQFNLLRFRRALYHIGLNFIAAQGGVDAALAPRYDALRRYVRSPRSPSESWPFGQVPKSRADIPHLIGPGFIDYNDAELVGIHIFQVLFLIDPGLTGALDSATASFGGVYFPSGVTRLPDGVIRAGEL